MKSNIQISLWTYVSLISETINWLFAITSSILSLESIGKLIIEVVLSLSIAMRESLQSGRWKKRYDDESYAKLLLQKTGCSVAVITNHSMIYHGCWSKDIARSEYDCRIHALGCSSQRWYHHLSIYYLCIHIHTHI